MDINRLLQGFFGQDTPQNPDHNESRNGGQSQNQNGGLGQLAGRAGGIPGLGSLPSGLAGGAAAGGLIALLMGSKSARKFGGKALTYGGLAVVGGLAYKAWNDYKANQSGNPAPAANPAGTLPTAPEGSGFDPSNQRDSAGDDLRLTLVRAMISASKADGHIDKDENARLQETIQSMALQPDEKAFLFDQMNAASDPVAIARLAATEEQATEVYLASALAIDIDTPEERRYLDRLGDALRLPDGLRRELDTQAARATGPDTIAP